MVFFTDDDDDDDKTFRNGSANNEMVKFVLSSPSPQCRRAIYFSNRGTRGRAAAKTAGTFAVDNPIRTDDGSKTV